MRHPGRAHSRGSRPYHPSPRCQSQYGRGAWRSVLPYGQSDQRLAGWNGWQISLGTYLAQPQQRRGIDRGPQVADQDLTFLDLTNVPRGNDKTISRDAPLRVPRETHFTADHVADARVF